jgi:hypothetical protein
MGFMDKAKKLAEQAQQKLDEAQESINQPSQPTPPEGEGVRYDEHGRPVREDAPPASVTPPPAAEPAAEGDANATPDPFKPLQQ